MACRLLPCRPRDDLAGDCVAAGRAGQLAAARPHGAASGADVSSAPAAAAGRAGCAVAARTAARLDARWTGPLFTSRALHAVGRFLTHPATGWIAMNVAYLGWHVPAAYELALRSPAWHEVEHACFLVTSLLFWLTVLQPWPSRARWSRWAVIPYLVSADLANTALSAFLAFSRSVLYPTYATAPRIFGLSAMQDQAAAGAFMWVVGST